MKQSLAKIDQAIFTSTQSGQNEGYHLAAHGRSLPADEIRELVQWGPAHDSLQAGSRISLNFHPLSSGRICCSMTTMAGAEYSGRGGERVYTHMFVAPEAVFSLFHGHAFRLLDALVAAGHARTLNTLPPELPQVELCRGCSRLNFPNLEAVLKRVSPLKLAGLIAATISQSAVGIASPACPRQLFSAICDLFPPSRRGLVSFTTGLRPSPRRPYRLCILPQDPQQQRQAARTTNLLIIDPAEELPSSLNPRAGWPRLVLECLEKQAWNELDELLRRADEFPRSQKLGQIASSLKAVIADS